MKAGPPAQLDFSDVPKAVVEGEPQPFEVRVLDDAGNLVTDGSPKVTLQLASGKGKLGGTLEAIAENGVARFPEVTYNGVDPFTVKAVSKGLPSNTVADPIPVVTPQGQPASVESAQALSKALQKAVPPGSPGPGQWGGPAAYPGWLEALTGPAGAATKVVVQPLKDPAQPGKPFAVDVELCDPAGNIVQGAATPITLRAVKKDGSPVPLNGTSTMVLSSPGILHLTPPPPCSFHPPCQFSTSVSLIVALFYCVPPPPCHLVISASTHPSDSLMRPSSYF